MRKIEEQEAEEAIKEYDGEDASDIPDSPSPEFRREG